MKKCENCNQTYNDTDRYCFKCNRPLVLVSEKEIKQTNKEQKKKSKLKTVLWFLGLIVLNVLMQVAFYFYNNYQWNESFEFQWSLLFWISVFYCICSLMASAFSDIAKNPEKYEAINKAKAEARQKQIEELKKQAEEDKKYKPKCPTCGCENVRRISSAERGVNAVAFGIYGTKRKCQFECQNPNCKYRW